MSFLTQQIPPRRPKPSTHNNTKPILPHTQQQLPTKIAGKKCFQQVHHPPKFFPRNIARIRKIIKKKKWRNTGVTVQFALVVTNSTPNRKMANALDTFKSWPVDQFWEERGERGGGGEGGKQSAMASDGILQRETYNEEDDENRSRWRKEKALSDAIWRHDGFYF